MTEESSRQPQVRLQLTTKDSALALPQDTGPILVPSSLRRYALSTLVNKLLGLEKPVPFEFLINGSYLRTSIDESLSVNGLSSETTVVAEFVRALLPPTQVALYEHDDWVSSVDVLSNASRASIAAHHVVENGQERILSGSYDGYLRMWNTSSAVLASSPNPAAGGHTGPVKSTKFLSPRHAVSCGLDRTVRVWSWEAAGTPSSDCITPYLELYGHTASVDSVAVHAPSNRILSASADHNVGLWSTEHSQSPEASAGLLPSFRPSSTKKRTSHQSRTKRQKGPLSLLRGHTEAVSEAIFDERDPTIGYSSSWDHSVRTWDLLTQTLVDTRTTGNALLSLAHLPQLNLIATGSSGKEIRLIDPRDSATTVSAMTLRGHSNAVVTLAADPESHHGLASGSYDGTCRVWDVRSKRSGKDGVVGDSVYVIDRESVKGRGRGKAPAGGVRVFGVCWDKTLGIVSAAEDRRVQINQAATISS